jgi:hypothetical protein
MASRPKDDAPCVLIRGDGVAAACCAHLLKKAGLRVRRTPLARPRVPAIMLSPQALTLMRDVFDDRSLFSDLPRIERRIVAWGPAEPIALRHAAVVTSDAELHDRLTSDDGFDDDAEPDFSIHAANPLPSEARPLRFGDRQAYAAQVALVGQENHGSCWVESVAGGWLFLIPDGRGAAWLLAVGAPHETLLAESRLVAPRIERLDGRPGVFDPCPRLATPAHGADWLACGATAIGFDPICGDGTAQAIRQAILASAVVIGIVRGGDRKALLDHYDAALIAAMRRHLALSADFYGAGGDGPWWRGELQHLVDGHRWCTQRLEAAGEPAFRLSGFDLVERELAA